VPGVALDALEGALDRLARPSSTWAKQPPLNMRAPVTPARGLFRRELARIWRTSAAWSASGPGSAFLL
jgi:hypothetical protein